MKVASVDRRLEAVRRFEEMTQLNRDTDGALRRQRAGRENLGEISSVEIFHRDVEVAALGAVFVHNRNVLTDPAELLLKLRAPALGLEDLLRVTIRSGRNQLERNMTTVPAIGCEEHDGHAAASDLVDDLVRSDANALKNRRHHRPGLTRGVVDDVERTS